METSMPLERRTILSIRGGGKLVVADAEADDDDCDESSNTMAAVSANPFLTKIRNVLRSLLEISDRKSPTMANILRRVIGKLESVMGIQLLLPQPEVKRKKTRSKKAKKAKSSSLEKVVPSTKSNKKSKSKKSATTPTPTSTTTKNTAAHQHISSKISTTNPNYRVQRELKEFIKSPPPNLTVKVGSNIRIWIISMTGAPNTIYEGETYRLRVQFPKDYPMVPPSVYFLPPTPQHEHVYTNGDICLSLLGKDWRPTMTAQSIAVSILSILSSAQSKSLPMDNARHSHNKPGQFQKDWVYHDDNC